MNLEGARRVMETTSHDTANQYLRFGWSLINQYVVPATADSPATVKFVLASIRRLEDTRQVVVLTEAQAVNDYLALGWKMIDKYKTALDTTDQPSRDFELRAGLAARRSAAPPRLAPTGCNAAGWPTRNRPMRLVE